MCITHTEWLILAQVTVLERRRKKACTIIICRIYMEIIDMIAKYPILHTTKLILYNNSTSNDSMDSR